MAYPRYLRDKARALRSERRLTLDEIAQRLALPRTTVWYWIRDLPLERPRRASAGQRKGNQTMRANYRRRREDAYAAGALEVRRLAAIPTFRDFVVLYIAEGYKRNRNVVSLCNSDPRAIELAARWIGSLTDKRLAFALQYHADQGLDELRRYWGERLGVDGDLISFSASPTAVNCDGDRGVLSTGCSPSVPTTPCFALGSEPGSTESRRTGGRLAAAARGVA